MNLVLAYNGHQLRRTKIIATLGPATDDREVLEGVIRAGADVLRLNMSHGSVEEQTALKHNRVVATATQMMQFKIFRPAFVQYVG